MKKRRRSAKDNAPPKDKIALIFAEDANDAKAIAHLITALWPDRPRIEYSRDPPILMRNLNDAVQRKRNGAAVAAKIRAWNIRAEVQVVVAHQDCDAIEPAHVPLSQRIRSELVAQGIDPIIVATPAWEIEAWWFLWPEAVAAVNRKWKKLTRKGNHGYINDAKRQLRNCLRCQGTVDYEESHSPRVAEEVKRLNLINIIQGSSDSFRMFRTDVVAAAAALA